MTHEQHIAIGITHFPTGCAVCAKAELAGTIKRPPPRKCRPARRNRNWIRAHANAR